MNGDNEGRAYDELKQRCADLETALRALVNEVRSIGLTPCRSLKVAFDTARALLESIE